ncbi:MAG TPA: FAD-binding oxidoreductase [Urbifossiella sp.]|jgi:glycolate oxidase FAD binding subunit
MNGEYLLIDDFGPLPVRRPESVAEVCVSVQEAAAGGQSIYPVGGRTILDVGLPPIKPGFALDTTALNQVIDYPARDMTITVQAGITMAKLRETLAAEGQWLPVDVPDPERATLGGAVALNISGPRRFGYGTLRDYVIGISFVTDEGNEVKAGGRVVKNVAGYDLMKLQVGAVGTLGVITQLTLKVKPRPEVSAVIRMNCLARDLEGVLDRLHASRSRPVVVDVATDRSIAGSAWAFCVGFEEKAATVEWQISTLLDEFKNAPVTNVTTERGEEARKRIDALTAATVPASPFLFKANVLPSRTAKFCNAAAELSVPVHAHALNGIVIGHSPDRILKLMMGEAESCGGNLVIRRCPTPWKKDMPVWGKPGGDRDLMRRVKQTLDPNNVFNPGRLFGDL